jgi:hypothetical protein
MSKDSTWLGLGNTLGWRSLNRFVFQSLPGEGLQLSSIIMVISLTDFHNLFWQVGIAINLRFLAAILSLSFLVVP